MTSPMGENGGSSAVYVMPPSNPHAAAFDKIKEHMEMCGIKGVTPHGAKRCDCSTVGALTLDAGLAKPQPGTKGCPCLSELNLQTKPKAPLLDTRRRA